MDYFIKIIGFIGVAIFLISSAFAQTVEIRTFHNEDSTLIKEIYHVDKFAKLNGQYKSYFINGTLEKEGFYTDNLPDSMWVYYFESGQPKMKGMLENGSSHGLWKYFYESGQLQMAGVIINGRREGNWEFYFENGKVKSEGQYKNNKKEGVWDYFYEEGELKAQAFFTHDRGKYKEYFADGKIKAEGLNVNGESDSTWVFYHENGKIEATGDFEHGKRTGVWKYFYDDESPSAHGNFVEGEKDGKWIYYHKNGKVSSEGALREGKKEGYWRIFSENGSFKAEGVFEKNDGKYTEYYESGALKAEGNIIDSKNHGLWMYYFEDGTKEGECEFTHGGGEYIGYYKDGSIKMKGTIKDGVNVGIWELYKGDGSLAGYYRPYYEDNKPFYKLAKDKKVERGDYIKPAYKFKNNKLRYFDPVINEFKGVILSTNPLSTIFGQLPIAIEYYMEDRLGYEAQVTVLRDPFFQSSEEVKVNKNYSRGFNLAIRQKFYHPEGKLGSFYFGHEVRMTSLKHYANVIDSTSTYPAKIKINTQETRFEYGIFVGDRWMQLTGDRYRNNSLGFTIDGFLGLGFGYRMYERNYSNNPTYDLVFNSVSDTKFVISPRIGINIGFVF